MPLGEVENIFPIYDLVPFPPDKQWLISPTHTPGLAPVLGGAPVHMVFSLNNKCFCAQPQLSKTQMSATGDQHYYRKDRIGGKDTELKTHQDRLWSSLEECFYCVS